MPISFDELNRGWIECLLRQQERITDTRMLAELEQRIRDEGGRLLRLLPLHFLFRTEDGAVLADAAQRVVAIQTKLLLLMVNAEGREALLDQFRVPSAMRRFVNWRELLEPEYLIARHDIVETPDGYKFCEFNIDSCVAGAEVFEFMAEYFTALGCPVPSLLGLAPPLRTLAQFMAQYALQKGLSRIVILDWSAEGGSAGKGYLSYERMRAHVAREFPGPVLIADETNYHPSWLSHAEASQTLVHRGFMMEEMTDGGTFLDRLIAAGTSVVNTYESEIRMNKRWFALFHQDRFQASLSPEERRLIASYIPPTLQIESANVPALLASKDRFIFKQNQSFGGAGIRIGDEATSDELRALWDCAGSEHWTAQTLCDTLPAIFPFDENFQPEPQNLVLGLYQYGTRFSGMLVRSSPSSRIVNASSGKAKLAWAMQLDGEARQHATSLLTRNTALSERELVQREP